MKIRLLSTALLAGLAFAQTANAQNFDDRWYLTGSAGFNIQDNDRGTRNAPFLGLGVGKFISENWSLGAGAPVLIVEPMGWLPFDVVMLFPSFAHNHVCHSP